MSPRAALAASLLCLTLPMTAAPVRAEPNSATLSAELERRLAAAKERMAASPVRTIGEADAIAARLRRPPPVADAKRKLATALWLRGEALVRLNRISEAVQPLEAALTLATDVAANSQLEGDIRLARAWIFSMHGDVATSLAEYHHSYGIFHALGNARSEAVALISISELYRKARDLKSALRYAQRAEEASPPDPALVFFIQVTVAAAQVDLGRNREALVQLRRAFAEAVRIGNQDLQAVALRNIARVELNLGHVAGARAAVARGMALRQAKSDGAAQFASVAAEIARKAGDEATARREIALAFAGVDLTKTTAEQRDAHETAYRLYKQTGDAAPALRHLEALKRIDDQATSLAASANTALMGARFDFKSQELRIAKLKADELQRSIELERTRRRAQQIMFGGAAAAGIVVLGLLAAFGLVMRRKRNELAVTNAELERALAARTEFLASTSHEIRTPLNGILGMAQVMLADPGASPAMRERLEVVKGAGLTMRALVDDILDVAKMETGRFTVAPHAMNLRETLEEVTRLWADQAGQRDIAFRVDLSECPGAIEGDAARIRQIVFNLLSNAIKFTGEGGVEVRACVLPESNGGERVRVAVRDTGIGIPEDKLAAIFEAFRQVDASTTRTYGGTGLGLAICRNLARTMGGDVTVESEIAKGSTFTLEMPIVRLVVPAPAAAAAPEPATLVIDRNPISRVMVKAMVEKLGAVVCVGSAEEAVAVIAKGGVMRIAADEATLGGEPEERQNAMLRLREAAAGVPIALIGTGDGLDPSAAGAALVAKPVMPGALQAALMSENAENRASGMAPDLVSRAA